MDLEQMSLLEVAVSLLQKKRTPQKIQKIIKEVIEIKNIQEDDYETISQLYTDITTSGRFIFLGEDNWDLKERQEIDLWDKDGSYFIKEDEIVDDDDDDNNLTVEDYELDDDKKSKKKKKKLEDIDEEEIEDIEEDEEVEEEEEPEEEPEEEIDGEPEEEFDEENDDFMDEDEYNDIMDTYEDMYDK